MKNMVAEMKNQQKGWKVKLNKKSEMENRLEEIRRLEAQSRRLTILVIVESRENRREENKNKNSKFPSHPGHVVPDGKRPCHQLPGTIGKNRPT